ncbi:MAG: hypothetical protein Q6373_015845 [Candidatus Sigynarchaeota archaeon]
MKRKKAMSKQARFIENVIAEVRRREKQVALKMFILGSRFPENCPRRCEGCTIQGCEDASRRRLLIHDALNMGSNIVMLFEDCEAVARASVDEELILMNSEIDMVIILPESFGSVAELVDFSHNRKIYPKMRVFVKKRYHPQQGESKSYLRDFLRKFDARGGRVYWFESDDQLVKDIGNICDYYRGSKCIDQLKKI